MKLVVEAVLPLFALILAGYVCGRRGVLGAQAIDSLNLFVVWLALPALLFQALAEARWSELTSRRSWPPSRSACWRRSSRGSCCSRGRGGRPLPDASIEALAASYPNTGFMGIPLCLAVFGRAGLQPAIIATILTACLLFGLSLALIEIGLAAGARAGSAIAKAAATLARNPLLVAPALGALFAIAHIPRPAPLTRFLACWAALPAPARW